MPFNSAVVALLARVSVQAIVLAALTWTFLFVCRVRRTDVRHAVWSIMSSRWLPAALAVLSVSMAMGAIVGRIVEDHTGSPLASVGVRIFNADALSVLADLDTDGAGRFEAPGFPAGDYRVEVSKPNFVATSLRFHSPGDGSPSPVLLVRLVRCGVVTGLVADHEGQPVRGATVFAIPKPAAGQPLRPFEDRRAGTYSSADERGQYRLYGLPPGEYAIAASVGMTGSAQTVARLGSRVLFYPTNAQPQFFKVSGGEEFRGVDFTIQPTALYAVQGKVEVPQPNGQFWLALTPVDQPGIALAVTVARSDGTFRFEGIQPGSYHLLASGPCRMHSGLGGHLEPQPLFARTRVEVGGQDLDGISLSLQRGRSTAFVLRSRASDQPERACPSTAQVTLSSIEDWGMYLNTSVEVNSAQARTIEDLAPGRYRISVTKLGDSCYSATSDVLDLSGPAASGPREILLAPAGSIRGRLTGAGKPSEFAIVLVSPDPAAGAQPLQAAMVGADGKFTFAGVRPGRYLIAAQPASQSSSTRWVPGLTSMFEIEVPGGAPTEMDLPAPVTEKKTP
jgi:hypothetical protein